jgi:hypothetical protein
MGVSIASRRVFQPLSPQRVALDRPVCLLRPGFIPPQGGDYLATRGRPTQQKRQRERARQEQRKIKDARRQEAKERKGTAPASLSGGDPDLEGIVAGPQPMSDWQLEGIAALEPEEEEAEEAGQTG